MIKEIKILCDIGKGEVTTIHDFNSVDNLVKILKQVIIKLELEQQAQKAQKR
jgi:hypothetical protein